MATVPHPEQRRLFPVSYTAKRCTKCGEVKPLSEFHRTDAKHGYYVPKCKACVCASAKARLQADPEGVRSRRNAWYAATRAERHRVRDAYRAANREQINAWKRANWARHREHNLARDRARWQARRERENERRRQYHMAHRDADLARIQRWYHANYERFKALLHKRRARKIGNGGSHTAAEWATLTALYDHRCLRCGRQEPQIKLTVDHVVPLSRGGTDDIGNLQPLCRDCNGRKHAKHIDYRPTAPGGRL